VTERTPFELATAELRKLGITLSQLPGEYRVNLLGGPDANALSAETLEEGLDPTVVSPAAKLAGGREVGANYRQRPSKRLPATRV
jgi:hypothetical protein